MNARAGGLIFDLDGTLVDSGADIALHLGNVAEARGLPRFALADVCAWVGAGGRALVRHAFPEAPTNEHEALYDALIASYRRAPVVTTTIFAGMGDVLDACVASGMKLAIVSNKPHELVVAIADALLTRWPWAFVGGSRMDVPRKPDALAVTDALAAMGVEAHACVMIGDSEADVRCAHAAGMPSVAVTWGFRDATFLQTLQPTYLVSSMHELQTALLAHAER